MAQPQERESAPNEAVSTGHPSYGIQHDLGALAAREWSYILRLTVVPQSENRIAEDSDQIGVRRLWCKVANKNAVFLLELLVLLLCGSRRVDRCRDPWRA